MSLAASGGGGAIGGAGGGLGGVAMAHQANAGQVAVRPPPQQQQNNNFKSASGTPAPPSSASALGADLLDKQQSLSRQQMKNVSHLPLVAVDLHASDPLVSMYPPKPDDPSRGMMPTLIGKMKSDLRFKPTENAHKTLRKFLAQDKTYDSLTTDSLAKASDKDSIILKKPQRWLGVRRIDQAPQFYRNGIVVEETTGSESATSAAIAEEPSQGAGVTLANSTLDGSSVPQNDDFDRVVFKARLHSSKKAITVLPEEAVQMLFHQAQFHVSVKFKGAIGPEEDRDEMIDYPLAVAVPAWAFHDAGVEALLDATAGNSNGVFFQRSLCALAGALLPRGKGEPTTPLMSQIDNVRAHMHKAYQIRQATDPGLVFEDVVVVLLFGMLEEGIECTAVELSSWKKGNAVCRCGDFRVLSNVSYQDPDPISRMGECTRELEEALERVASDSDGPTAIILYGGPAQQEQMGNAWEGLKEKQEEWKRVPVFATKSDCVSNGAAVLGAVSHGRICRVMSNGNKEKAELAVNVRNVAPVAVGIQMNYHGGQEGQWTPTRTVFDFDRRVPAGPSMLDLNAAECVVHRTMGPAASEMSDEELLEATKKNEGAKHIPKREEAALNFQIQIYQRWTRDGEWTKVGDPMEPLVKEDPTDEEKKVACEEVELQISLGATGMITTSLVGERESVVQAVETAKWSYFYNVLFIVVCVLFFGGFLARSYWEEYVLQRDTKRLLAFYKHVLPGSIADGDVRNAQFIAYRYRHKKEKLWRLLEKKYGQPVRHAHEWDEEEEGETTKASSSSDGEEEEDVVNLDEDSPDGEPGEEMDQEL